MTRRALLAACLATVGVAIAAPIPKALKKKRPPCLKTADDHELFAWAENQDEWRQLCQDQWPPLSIFSSDTKAMLDDGEDLGHELRFQILRELRWIWNGNSLPMIDP